MKTVIAIAALALVLAAHASARAAAPECRAAQAPDCLYSPPASFGIEPPFERRTTYTDASGQTRELRALLRVPIGAPEPWPVVVWSHGGADGKNDPANSMAEWSAASAAAGYLTLSIAHPGRSDPSREQLCAAIGIVDPTGCANFKHLNWDRPHDIRAVLDAIGQMNASGALAGRIDLARIAVGGHSAGSGGAQSVGGARRMFVNATSVDLSDPRPIAFLAFSPQQPGSEAFFDTDFRRPEHSWAAMSRPVLTATGDGDSTCKPGIEPGSCVGDTPFGRRLGFQRMPAGGKYQLYVHDADAFHTLFELNAGKCAQLGVNQAKCDEIVRWLTAAGLAFLDGHVRGSASALQWLESDRIERASLGVAEWLRK
jgi:hypothetical protein